LLRAAPIVHAAWSLRTDVVRVLDSYASLLVLLLANFFLLAIIYCPDCALRDFGNRKRPAFLSP
jgi:hypothetical protein